MKCITYFRVRVGFFPVHVFLKMERLYLQLACNFCFIVMAFLHTGLVTFLINLKISIQADPLMIYLKKYFFTRVSGVCMLKITLL